MFNATEYRARAKHPVRLDSYYKTKNFTAIAKGLLDDGVPEDEIMRTTRGPQGTTMLHDAFFIDFMGWVGGAAYYRAIRKFVTFSTST